MNWLNKYHSLLLKDWSLRSCSYALLIMILFFSGCAPEEESSSNTSGGSGSSTTYHTLQLNVSGLGGTVIVSSGSGSGNVYNQSQAIAPTTAAHMAPLNSPTISSFDINHERLLRLT